MAITRVQATPQAVLAFTPVTLTFPAPPTVGNTIVVIAILRAASAIPTPTDNKGHTYQQVITSTNPGEDVAIYITEVITTGNPFTVTIPNNTGSVSGVALEFAGKFTADRSATNTGVSTTPSVGPTSALRVAEALLIAAISGNSAQASITVGVTSPVWNQEFESLSLANAAYGEGVSKILTGTIGATPSASWTWPTNAVWAAALVAFGPIVVPEKDGGGKLPMAEVVPLGFPVILKQNVVYALPTVEAVLFTDTAAPTFQQSNSYAFTNNVAVTLTGGSATLGGGFIKSTAGDAVVTLKRD